jgi:hypothetical protein
LSFNYISNIIENNSNIWRSRDVLVRTFLLSVDAVILFDDYWQKKLKVF